MQWFTIAAALCIAVSPSGKPDQHPGAPEQKNGQPNARPSIVTFIDNQACTSKQGPSENSAPHWYTRLQNPEWWLVILGFPTLVFVACQALQSARATKAMERSSTVLMDIERARLVVIWENLIHIDQSPGSLHVGDGILAHYFNWSLANKGKTQAVLTATWTRFTVLRNVNDLPATPDYTGIKEVPYVGEPLHPAADNKPQTEWFSAPLETGLSYENMETKYRSRDCFLYAYGYARYRDVFGRSQELRFGVVYNAEPAMNFQLDCWSVAGPEGYNRST